MNDDLFIQSFKELRRHIHPVLNQAMQDVLAEAERKLTKVTNPTKGIIKGSKMTKEQILNRWLNKY